MLLRGYPRRFRSTYEESIVEAFTLELQRARSTGSWAAVAGFWTLMIVDLLSGVTMTRGSDAWRRLRYSARLIRGSTGFTAATSTLVVIPVWAWSRFASYHGVNAGTATLTFCVSALHALVIWVLSRTTALSYTLWGARSGKAPGVAYISIRRARIVADFARASAAMFLVAAVTQAKGTQRYDALGSRVPPIQYWLVLSLTLAAIVGVYFSVDRLLRLRLPAQ